MPFLINLKPSLIFCSNFTAALMIPQSSPLSDKFQQQVRSSLSNLFHLLWPSCILSNLYRKNFIIFFTWNPYSQHKVNIFHFRLIFDSAIFFISFETADYFRSFYTKCCAGQLLLYLTFCNLADLLPIACVHGTLQRMPKSENSPSFSRELSWSIGSSVSHSVVQLFVVSYWHLPASGSFKRLVLTLNRWFREGTPTQHLLPSLPPWPLSDLEPNSIYLCTKGFLLIFIWGHL